MNIPRGCSLLPFRSRLSSTSAFIVPADVLMFLNGHKRRERSSFLTTEHMSMDNGRCERAHRFLGVCTGFVNVTYFGGLEPKIEDIYEHG